MKEPSVSDSKDEETKRSEVFPKVRGFICWATGKVMKELSVSDFKDKETKRSEVFPRSQSEWVHQDSESVCGPRHPTWFTGSSSRIKLNPIKVFQGPPAAGRNLAPGLLTLGLFCGHFSMPSYTPVPGPDHALTVLNRHCSNSLYLVAYWEQAEHPLSLLSLSAPKYVFPSLPVFPFSVFKTKIGLSPLSPSPAPCTPTINPVTCRRLFVNSSQFPPLLSTPMSSWYFGPLPSLSWTIAAASLQTLLLLCPLQSVLWVITGLVSPSLKGKSDDTAPVVTASQWAPHVSQNANSDSFLWLKACSTVWFLLTSSLSNSHYYHCSEFQPHWRSNRCHRLSNTFRTHVCPASVIPAAWLLLLLFMGTA